MDIKNVYLQISCSNVDIMEVACASHTGLLFSALEPINKGLIQQIESIQQSFTRKIAIGNLTNKYWDRLSHLKLYSLQRRRECYAIIYVWKIIEGHVPNISGEGHSVISKLHDFTHRNGRTCSFHPSKKWLPF